MKMDYEIAKDIFDYDPETGLLIWRVSPRYRIKIGDVAGTIYRTGYRVVGFRGKRYLAHRLAWLLVTKKWPEHEIDHINGVTADNRLVNLREATHAENQQNMKAASNTGITGVSLGKDGFYKAQLRLDGKNVLSTSFKNFDDAVAAVTEAKRKHHTFHPEMVNR